MPITIDAVESFRPAANSRCLCGKKVSFDQCCGSTKSDRPPPKGVFLRRNFLPSEKCDRLVRFAESNGDASDLAVFSKEPNSSAEIKTAVNSDRVSMRLDLGDKQATIDKWVADIYHKFLAKKIGKSIRGFSLPDLMRYEQGGYYKLHADSELFDKEIGAWKKVLDRDYSLLLYLNSDYEGGAIHFEHFNYTYQPQKGDLLIFPSDNLYLHEARLVTSGRRYVIVSWATVK